jgi:hypothetical protein
MSQLFGEANPIERQAGERYNEELRTQVSASSISELAGQEALRAGDYAMAALYYRSASADCLDFSLEQLRYRTLSLLSTACLHRLKERDLARAGRAVASSRLAEQIVASSELPELYAWRGVLFAVGGNREAASRWLKRGHEAGFRFDPEVAAAIQRMSSADPQTTR